MCTMNEGNISNHGNSVAFNMKRCMFWKSFFLSKDKRFEDETCVYQ